MANTFKIPIVNPFRFVNANAYAQIDPRYNTLPFDMKIDGATNPNGFYPQKWQTNDFTAFQLDSDFNDVVFSIYPFVNGSYYEGIPYKTINPTVPAVPVSGVSWLLYEFAVNFADWAEGLYVGVLTYTDQTATLQKVQTSPLNVRVKHPGTLLYEYYNTQNDKGIVWTTGIKMSVRVEGLIRAYDPSTLTEEYVDQKYNVYPLNDIPYRKLINYIGTARGLPDWIIDKMNVIFTLNSVMIDGTPYAKYPGQSFKITRPEKGPNEDGYAEIQIIPNENFNLEAYNTGLIPDEDFVVINRSLPFYNNAADIAIQGIFKTHFNLVGIGIWNRGGNPFTLKVGTAAEANDIRQFDVTADITSFLQINKYFAGATDIYISGLEGTDLDINVDYKNYDAPQVTPGVTQGGFTPNVIYDYDEFTIGDFDRDWNVATGLGKVGTNFEGCALCDGQNGTKNLADTFTQGWNKLFPLLRGSIQGSNTTVITKNQLPAAGVAMFENYVNPAAGDVPTTTSTVARARSAGNQALNYEIVKGTIGGTPTLGLTAHLGNGDPLDLEPERLIVAKFIKLPV